MANRFDELLNTELQGVLPMQKDLVVRAARRASTTWIEELIRAMRENDTEWLIANVAYGSTGDET